MKQHDFTHFVDQLAERGEPFAVATVVRIHGSSLGKPGFKAVVSREGRIVFGTIGGVCPESAVATMSQEAIRTGRARVVTVHLEDARSAVDGTLRNPDPDEVYVETNCGGTMEIYVEPYLPADRLILIGQGGKDDVEDGPREDGQDPGLRDRGDRPPARAQRGPGPPDNRPRLRPEQLQVQRLRHGRSSSQRAKGTSRRWRPSRRRE